AGFHPVAEGRARVGLRGHRGHPSGGDHTFSSVALTLISAPAKSRETGQSAAASSTTEVKPASSMPSTTAVTVILEVVTVGLPSTSSRETVASTSSFVGGVWFSPRQRDRAIEKHEEWAAASSSSGLDLPPGASVREAHVTCWSSSAPLLEPRRVPVPDASGPSQ